MRKTQANQLNLYNRIQTVASRIYSNVDLDVAHSAFLELIEKDNPTDNDIKTVFRGCQMARRRILMSEYQGKLDVEVLQEIHGFDQENQADPDVNLGFMWALESLGTFETLATLLDKPYNPR